jgi:hypothetical protein
VAIVADVRRTIGHAVRLMLDFNQSQTTASAVERIRRPQDLWKSRLRPKILWVIAQFASCPAGADFRPGRTGGSLTGWRTPSQPAHPILRWSTS